MNNKMKLLLIVCIAVLLLVVVSGMLTVEKTLVDNALAVLKWAGATALGAQGVADGWTGGKTSSTSNNKS